MNVIRVELPREFMLGDDVVLLAMDTAGLDTFATAINHAEETGGVATRSRRSDSRLPGAGRSGRHRVAR
jgi:hypothetical protein